MRLLGPLVVLRGGWASSLYTFTLQHAELDDVLPTTVVLKLYAPSVHGYEHALREWRALTHLHVVHYSAPNVVLFEPDVRHLGHPFMVMDHVPGTSFWHAFEDADSSTQARLTQLFVSRLVALHALDPHLLDPAAVLTHPHGYLEHELEQLRRDSANRPRPGPSDIVRWLEQRKEGVRCQRSVILHRDYHPWNVLVDAAERLWVIDWDWRIGDARFDLAWTCMLMQRSDCHAFSGAVRDEYARQAGGPLDDLDYFEVLTTVRWLLNILPSVELDADFGHLWSNRCGERGTSCKSVPTLMWTFRYDARYRDVPVSSGVTLSVTVGLPGVGKTSLARELERVSGALRLTPDEWMIPLFGVRWVEFGDKRAVLEGRLIWVAHHVLRAGGSVILDFGCWSSDERHALRAIADLVGANFALHYVTLAEDERRRRALARWREAPEETFEMTGDDHERFRTLFTPPTADELHGSPHPPPPIPFVSWPAWASDRWPTLPRLDI